MTYIYIYTDIYSVLEHLQKQTHWNFLNKSVFKALRSKDLPPVIVHEGGQPRGGLRALIRRGNWRFTEGSRNGQ